MNDATQTIEVSGSYGLLKVDQKGHVISCEHYDAQETEYGDIVWFDLQEAEDYYGALEDSYDILELGFKTVKGEYVDPDWEFRKMQVDGEVRESWAQTVEFFVTTTMFEWTELDNIGDREEGKPHFIRHTKRGAWLRLDAYSANWLMREFEHWSSHGDVSPSVRRSAAKHVEKLLKVFPEAFCMEANQ